MALLELREVTRRFGALTAVDEVTLSIEAGEFFSMTSTAGNGGT